jgi:hypothetical protein
MYKLKCSLEKELNRKPEKAEKCLKQITLEIDGFAGWRRPKTKYRNVKYNSCRQ